MHFNKLAKRIGKQAACIVLTVGLVLTGQPAQMLLDSGIVEAKAAEYGLTYTVGNSTYTYNVNDDETITITGWEGTDTEIVIPESIEGTSVTTIGLEAFKNCSTITHIKIPESVTYIETYAFRGCSSLESIIIPNGVTDIGTGAFWLCSSLTEITIPKNVKSIENFAFRACSNLTSINVSEENETYKSIDGVLFSKDGSRLIACPGGKTGTYTIPENVTTLETFAFANCSKLENILISESVIYIGDYAFSVCSNLTSITIPKSVTNIGISVLSACSVLENIDVADESAHFKSVDGVLFSEDGSELVAYPCGREGKYIIPEGTTSIAYGAFSENSGLTEITIPESVINIGGCAFYKCVNVIDIVIPESVTSIGIKAFYGSGLTSIEIPEKVEEIGMYALGYISVNSTATKVEDFEIYGYSGTVAETYATKNEFTFVAHNAGTVVDTITYISVPSELTITVGESVTLNVESDSTEEVPKYTFVSDHESTFSVDENGTVTGIKTGTGYVIVTSPLNSSLTALCRVTVKYEESTYVVGNSTYSYVKDVNNFIVITGWSGTDTEVSVPETIDGVVVKSIEKGTFDNATEVTSITIPSGVVSIANGVFNNCSKLEKILVAEGNERFKSVDGVLINTTKFEQVDLSNEYGITNETEIADLVAPEAGTYYIGTNLSNNYIFKIQVTEENGNVYTLETLNMEAAAKGTFANGDIVLAGDNNVFEVIMSTNSKVDSSYKTWEDGYTSTQRIAFGGQANLLTPKNVIRFTVSDKATVKVWWVKGEAMRQIGLYREAVSIVKYPNNAGTSYTIPEEVTSIGRDAFVGCNLMYITLHENITNISEFAFENTNELIDIDVVGNNSKYKSINGALCAKNGELIEIPAKNSFYNIQENPDYSYDIDNEDVNYVYTSDIFYGYSEILERSLFLMLYEGEMQSTLACVQNEYVETDAFLQSVVATSFPKAFDRTEVIKFLGDKWNLTEFEISKHLDAANVKFIESLCSNQYIYMDDVDTINKYLKTMQQIVEAGEALEKFKLDYESYAENKKTAQTYSDFYEWSFAYLKDYCTYIDPADFETLKTKYHTYFSVTSNALNFSMDAMEFAQGLINYILLYDMQIAIVEDIINNQDSDTLLYKGMSRYKNQLQRGFVNNFILENIDKGVWIALSIIRDKAAEWILKEGVESYDGLIGITGDAIKLTCGIYMGINGLSDPDDYMVSTVLGEYAREMYDYLNNKAKIYRGSFVSDDIIEYEKAFDYCMTASRLALEESRVFAKYNQTYDENYVDDVLLQYNDELYEKYTAWIKNTLLDSEKEYWETEKNAKNTYKIKNGDYEILGPTDNIENGKIYTFNNQIFGTLELVNSQLSVPKDVTIIIQGDLKIDEKSSVVNNGILIVNGSITTSGGSIDNYGQLVARGAVSLDETMIANNGIIEIAQDLTIYGQDVTNNSNITVHGNLSYQGMSGLFDYKYVYLYQNGGKLNVYGNVLLKTNSYIQGNNGAIIYVKGDVTFEPGYGLTASRDCGLLIKSGKLYCDGNIEEIPNSYAHGKLELSENAELYSKGNILMSGYESNNIVEGNVYLNGSTVQKIRSLSAGYVDVSNDAGIELVSDIKVYGYLNMNGNPVVGNKKILLYEGATLSEGTIYPIISIEELRQLNYSIQCNDIYLELSDGQFVIDEGKQLIVYNKFTKVLNSKLNIINNGEVKIGGDMNIDYLGGCSNYGTMYIDGSLAINSSNSSGAISTGNTTFNNYGLIVIGENLLLNRASKFCMYGTEAQLYLGGNLTRLSTASKADLIAGKVVLNGTNIQTISGITEFGVLEIENECEEGIEFANDIKVTQLFNHNRNKFSLLNEGEKSVFVDYDNDGILDNLDEYPLIKYEQVEAPMSSLLEGTYVGSQIVEISSDTIDAEIYYTLDGSIPSSVNGIKYTNAINIVCDSGVTKHIVIKAIAVKNGMKASEVVTFEYTIKSESAEGVLYKKDGIWCYYVNEKHNTNYIGLAENVSGKWYVENGIVTLKTTGLYKVDGVWYYISGSKVQSDYTGLMDNASGKWYVQKGIISLKYNGNVTIDGVTYKISGSKVTGTVTAEPKVALKKVNGVWGYYVNDILNTSYTGLADNSSGKWYVEKGIVTMKSTGLYKVASTWYYVSGSKVQTNYTGIAKNSSGTWYVEKGVVSLKYNGNVTVDGVTYKVANSKVTGTVSASPISELKKVNGVWGYYVAGILDTSYTGLAENSLGTWYVQNGTVSLKASGLYKVDGVWYYVSCSKVQNDYTGLATNSAGTWYVEEGVVSLKYNGKVTIEGVEYTVVGSKVK